MGVYYVRLIWKGWDDLKMDYNKNQNYANYSCYSPPKPPHKAALVLGIVGLCLSWTALPSIVLGTLAIIFGIIHYKESKSYSHTGIITGALALFVSILMLMPFFILMGDIMSDPFPGSYDHIESSTVDFFVSNQNSFEDAKDTVLKNQSADNVSIKKIMSIQFENMDTTQKITFQYGTFGGMDAKWWGIYYSSDDKPSIDKNYMLYPYATEPIEATTEGCYFLQRPDGSIYYATKRISKSWFFYFMDESSIDAGILAPHWSAK